MSAGKETLFPLPHPYETEAELARVIHEMRDEFDALADDALQLCDQHISPEVRKETQLRIIERIQRRQIAASPSRQAGSSEPPYGGERGDE